MKRLLFLCILFIFIVSPPVMPQEPAVDTGSRLMRLETTMGQLNERVNGIENRLDRIDSTLDRIDSRLDSTLDRIDSRLDSTLGRMDGRLDTTNSRLDTLIMWVVSLIAASFISLFVLILQIKTQLSTLNAKVGSLQENMSGLNEKVDKLEERIDGVERRTGAQLNHIRKALDKQLGMDFNDEPQPK